MAETPKYETVDDPYGSFNFYVEIDDADGIKALFQEVSGLKGDVEVFEIKEGGVNDRTHTFPGRVKWGPVTLKRGIDSDQAFYNWWRAIVENKTAGDQVTLGGEIYSSKNRRRTVTITMFDEDFTTAARKWTLQNAWPQSWEGAALNSGGSELAFETIVLSHDGVTEKK